MRHCNMKILDLLILPVLAAALCGCGGGIVSGAGESCASDAGRWKSSVDCMNGCCLVEDSTGLMGLADAHDGSSIVPPLYGELFFLTDDLLAGFEGGKWSFLDTSGHVLAVASGDAGDDADALLAEYRRIRRRQLDAWEEVVKGYERFCLLCASGDVSLDRAEAVAGDTRSADSLAVDALLSRLAGVVELPYSDAVKSALVDTYRDDLVKVSEFAVNGGRKNVSVLRYLRRDAVGSVFDSRSRRVVEMTEVARLKSRRVGILEGMDVRFDRQNVADRSVVELSFTYKGQPVRNIDYRFFNGKQWSGLLSAKDGKGYIEVSPGSRIDDYRILYESDPANLRHIYREVRAVERAFDAGSRDTGDYKAAEPSGTGASGTAASGASPSDAVAVRKIDFSAVRDKVMDVMSRESFADGADSTVSVTLTPVLFTENYEDAVSRICAAVTDRDYGAVRGLFTDTGYDIFLRLISYGNARVLSYDSLHFYALSDETFCRSVPMAFSFSGNSRRFVEDVVFTFNADGLVSNLTFSLGKAAVSDICSHDRWSEEARLILVSFLENYKTAYALKRLDYISSIFDDDALIITGRVLKSVPARSEYGTNRYVRFTRQNKTEYVRNLARVFDSQEYINIQFSDSEVVKLGKGGQLFGIRIRQEYFSTTYSDVGYLFVLVDLTDCRNPVIHVRTWQDSPDRDFGVIGPYHF